MLLVAPHKLQPVPILHQVVAAVLAAVMRGVSPASSVRSVRRAITDPVPFAAILTAPANRIHSQLLRVLVHSAMASLFVMLPLTSAHRTSVQQIPLYTTIRRRLVVIVFCPL